VKRLLPLLFFSASAAFAADGALQMSTIGDLTTDSAQVIRDCRIGYRTYGSWAMGFRHRRRTAARSMGRIFRSSRWAIWSARSMSF
jgi:hypothetical protein